MSRLDEWLFLGSRFNAANLKSLQRHRITHILNCSADAPNYFQQTVPKVPESINETTTSSIQSDNRMKDETISRSSVHGNDPATESASDPVPLPDIASTSPECSKCSSPANVISASSVPSFEESLDKSRVHPTPLVHDVSRLFEYQHLRLIDNESEDLLSHLPGVTLFLETLRMEGKRVLVHCNCGVSRSVSIVLAYLIKYGKDIVRPTRSGVTFETKAQSKTSSTRASPSIPSSLTFSSLPKHASCSSTSLPSPGGVSLVEAFQFVHQCRPMVCPNIGFLRQLGQWEELVRGQSTLGQLPLFRQFSGTAPIEEKSKCSLM